MSYLYDLIVYPIELVIEAIYVAAEQLFHNPGLSIVAVSLVVNFLVLPLYKKSDAMQEQERQKQKEMEHWVKHIRRTFKGDERFLMLSAYYRQQNYKPIYALKGSFSLLLQIPFFIAAYHFLSNLASLNGESFLMIANLGKQDGILRLGGLTVNLLPLLMTFFNVLSGVIYTRGFSVKEKVQLYGMAAIFLVLLYGSPSGLVLYWTLNNLFSLLKNVCMKLVRLPGRVRPEQAPLPEDRRLFVLCGIFLTVFLGAVIPLAAISSSPSDFAGGVSPAALVLHNLCIFGGAALLWGNIFYSLCGNRGRRGFGVVLGTLCLAAAANFMLFGKNYGIISTIFVFDVAPTYPMKELIGSGAVTVLLLCGALLLWRSRQAAARKLMLVLLCGAFALTAVNGFSTARAIREAEGLQEEETEEPAERTPRITLSREGKNVVVLMLDRAFSGFVPYLFEEMPALSRQFEGFVYYPNTVSFGSHTVFAAAALFGGYEYTPFAMNMSDLTIPEAYIQGTEVMPFLFSANDYQVSVCDIPYAGYSNWPDMAVFDKYTEGRGYSLIGRYMDSVQELTETSQEQQKRNLFCYCLFKSAPVALRSLLYDGGAYRSSVLFSGSSMDMDFLRNYSALDALPRITEVQEGAADTFLMMNNEATHCNTLLEPETYRPSYKAAYGERTRTDGAGNTIELDTDIQITHYHVNAASLLQLGEWFDYLRQQGVWDNTRVILVSDHGYRYMDLFTEYDFMARQKTEAYWSLLMMKDFEAAGPVETDSAFMTVADVPALAARDIIPDAANPFTGNLLNSSEKQEPQYVTSSENYALADHEGDCFDTSDGLWFTVQEDIFRSDCWNYAE